MTRYLPAANMRALILLIIFGSFPWLSVSAQTAEVAIASLIANQSSLEAANLTSEKQISWIDDYKIKANKKIDDLYNLYLQTRNTLTQRLSDHSNAESNFSLLAQQAKAGSAAWLRAKEGMNDEQQQMKMITKQVENITLLYKEDTDKIRNDMKSADKKREEFVQDIAKRKALIKQAEELISEIKAASE